MSDIELTPKQSAKIRRALKALDDVRKELQSENRASFINWYLEGQGNLNLLSDTSHDLNLTQGGQNHDAIIDSFDFKMSSGGGW
jgi:ferric iron reductase protein FhuF